MAISVVQRVASPTTYTVTTGNNLIFIASAGSSGQPTDSAGNIYKREYIDSSSPIGSTTLYVAYNIIGGAGITLTVPGAAVVNWTVYEVSGLASSSCFVQGSTVNKQNSATSLTSNSIVQRFDSELLIGYTLNDGAPAAEPTISLGAGYSNLLSNIIAGQSFASEELIGGSTTATFSATTNTANIYTYIFAFSSQSFPGRHFNNSGLRPHPFSPGLAR